MTKFPQATVRLADSAGHERLTELCQYLGYLASPAEVQQCLSQIEIDEHHAVYVAVANEQQIAGWVHVYIRQLLQTNLQTEIGGIVVDEELARLELAGS